MKLTHSLTAVAFGLAMLAAPAAQAFTIDNQSTSSGSARYSDPDAQFDNDGNKQSTIKQGNTTFRFGTAPEGSFNQRYNTDRMFDPIGRPER